MSAEENLVDGKKLENAGASSRWCSLYGTAQSVAAGLGNSEVHTISTAYVKQISMIITALMSLASHVSVLQRRPD
jgi:hypothetical protein